LDLDYYRRTSDGFAKSGRFSKSLIAENQQVKIYQVLEI